MSSVVSNENDVYVSSVTSNNIFLSNIIRFGSPLIGVTYIAKRSITLRQNFDFLFSGCTPGLLYR